MTNADPLMEALERTWPAASIWRLGPWTLRDGQGGGKRVSAASADGPVTEAEIDALEDEMEKRGETPLVRLGTGEQTDEALAARRYEVLDRTLIMAVSVGPLSKEHLPRLSAIPAWPPLARMREIWAEGDIGPGRIAVMERAKGAKSAFLGRMNDRPAGVAFAAIHGDIVMIHALHVLPEHRRSGAGRNLVIGVAKWAAAQGASTLAAAVTEANCPARALYSSLGFSDAAGYHYRRKMR